MRHALSTIAVLVALQAALLSGCASDSIPASARPDATGLECILVGPSICELGSAPELRVEIANSGTQDILLVRSLDGSDVAFRFPHCSFEVLGPGGESVVERFLGCGNVNPLTVYDFVHVPAGEAFDPFGEDGVEHVFGARQLNASMFDTPGEYRVKFVYSTDSDDLVEWNGLPNSRFDSGLHDLLRQVPKARLESAEFVVTVVDTDR